MGSPEPEPGTTFELRFDTPMVKEDRVGLAATNSPLAIGPRLAGTFTWLSVRSGVFTPTEPLALDKTYTLTLQPGLQCADGRPCNAVLDWTITTPAFDLVASSPQQTDSNAYSMPQAELVFNADVRAADLRGMLFFRNNSGQEVPADVRQGTAAEYWASSYELGGSHSCRTWKQEAESVGRFAASSSERVVSQDPTNEVANLLIASPQHSLPIGNHWELVVPRGVDTADHLLVSRNRHRIPIGNITPFMVRDVTPQNVINSGASVSIEFSKAIPDSLTNTFREWINIGPHVENLKVRIEEERLLTILGDFQGGSEYSITLKPGFQAVEPFTLQGSNKFTIEMPHVSPRLYFPALSRDQMASGKRTFPLLAINVADVRLRAKLMGAHTAIHALRGFRSYFASRHEPENYNWQEPYRALDYNVLPGTTVYNEKLEFGMSAAISDAATNLNLDWDTLLNGRHAGVVFLDAHRVDGDNRDPALGTQALIQLTDLGMVWKNSPSGVEVFIFSQSTGQPVSGAIARLYGEENEPLEESPTDTNGLAHLEAKPKADWIAVEHGDDFHALPLDGNRVWMYEFHLPYAGYVERDDARRVLMFSDRNLYRPGETMNFDAIVREWSSAGLNVPSELTGTLECVDPRGTRFFQTNAAFSLLGSWSTLVPLPANPAGYYEAKLRLGSNTYAYSFQVQDFQPNAFEITLPWKYNYFAGEPMALPLSAHYLFGKSLSHAQVAWSLTAWDADFKPAHFRKYNFRREEIATRYGAVRSSISLNGRGMLMGTTNFVIAPEVPMNPAAPQPRTVQLLAEVTDINQQTLSEVTRFTRHSSDFYLGLRQAADVLTNGSQIPLEVAAVAADEKPWRKSVKAHLSLQHVDWQTVRVQGSGMTARYHNEPVVSNVLEREISIEPVALPESSDDEAQGNSLTGLPSLDAGEYLVEVNAKDDAGRPIASSLDFRVSAPCEKSWNYRNDVQLSLKPDHKAYAAGETAEILVEAPFSGTALVSIEREKVLRSFVAHLEGNAPSIRVPLESNDVPNVFVSVTLTRGSEDSPHKIKEPEYRMGCCELPVENPQNRLGVEITSSQTNYLPGAPVDVAVRVTDSAQRPVAGAESILYAVDDGILGLTDYTLPDPYSFFYSTHPLGVQTSVSLPNLLPEDPEALEFENKGYMGGGGGFDRVRKNFLACAFWNASLTTDTDGTVHAHFTAPDSLTRYHLFAVVHTAENHFGSSQSAFQISKPLIVQPALPAIANITDHLVARAVVLNQTRISGDVIITLELDDKAKAAGPEAALIRRITIPSNGSVPVEFQVEMTDTGEAKWVWKARFVENSAGNFVDAVQSTLTVGHIAPVIREVLLTRAIDEQTNLLAFANPQLPGGRGTITVNVANTRLNELNETASQLLHYPYGCAEQTGSSLLPWILLRDAPGLLPLRWRWRGTNDSAAAIRAGIERLFTMQTESGGLAYWPHEKDPMLWASAYGGMVLALAQRHGLTVPNERFDHLLTYLSKQLRSSGDDTDLSDSCLAAYALALAGRAEPAYHEKLYSLRGKLGAEDRALLALAIAEAHGPAGMIRELLQTNTMVHSNYEDRFDCGAREDAIRLLAWISYQPEDWNVDKLVDDLIRDQKNAHWETTQGNAWGLLALMEYAQRVEIKRQPIDGQLTYAGQSIPFHVDDRTNVFSHSFAITNIGEVPLLLTKQSTNCLYTTVTIEARPPELPQPRQDRGFSIERNYDRLDDNDQLQGTNELRVGDRVLVTLHVQVHDTSKYMVIDDPLPATLEAINPEFRSREARSSSALTEDGTWWMSDFNEIRKDRCLSFANYVEPGTYTLRYIARVRAAGIVTAPSAKAEEMYHPERCGLTATQVLTSKNFE
jgi:uncharacterized protein YfaS (alpha-2-macroglobulin family)